MWRCVCGHAFYSSLPPTCPACDRPVNADEEETVTLGARRLPFHVWEAEVMIRAAGWAAVYRGTGLVLGGVLTWATGVAVNSIAIFPVLVAQALGACLVLAGFAAFQRAWLSRWVIFSASAVMVPCFGCLGLAASRALFGDPVFALVAMAGQLASDVFVLFAVLSKSGDWVFELGARRDPVAPLSSAWRIGRSLRAWAALGAVCLAALSAAILAWLLPHWAATLGVK